MTKRIRIILITLALLMAFMPTAAGVDASLANSIAKPKPQGAASSASTTIEYVQPSAVESSIVTVAGVSPLYPFTAGDEVVPLVYDMPYVIGVDTVNQVITIVAKGDSGAYDVPVKHFICSTGTAKNPTPAGSYILPVRDRGEWAYFKTYKCYVRYPVNIFGDYFFHSLLYSRQSIDSLTTSSLRNLGSPASHGCIRMLDDDVQWLSENCLGGTLVVVYSGVSDPNLNAALRPAYQ